MWNAFIGLMVNVLLFIYSLVGNFGVAIILFTLLIRVVTHPLTVKQVKGSAAMTELNNSKEWQEIQKKYKDNKEKLAQEQMRVYKELGINPLGSCLPTLIQLPIIIGLYQAIIQALATTPLQLLTMTREIYPGFLNIATLIPLKNTFLWMNLGQPDLLRIPGLSFPIPILAVIVVVTTYIQSKLMTPPTTNPDDKSSQMMGMMNIYMPFLMGYLALTLASGLSLYFVVSNLFTVGQYALLGKANWSQIAPRNLFSGLLPKLRKQPVSKPSPIKSPSAKPQSAKKPQPSSSSKKKKQARSHS